MPAAILTWPDLPAPESERWLLEHHTQIFTSPISGREQRLSLPRTRWRAELFFPYLTEQEGRTLSAFFARIQGAQKNFFYAPAHRAQTLWNDNSTATTFVAAGNALQGDNPLLQIDFRRTSRNHRVNAGDYFSLLAAQGNSALHVVTQAWSSANYRRGATLSIAPPLRFLPPVGTIVNILEPVATMRLLDDRQAELLWRSGKRIDNLSLSLIETW